MVYNLTICNQRLIPSHLDYYRGFNNSIGTFGGVLQYINGIKRIDRK